MKQKNKNYVRSHSSSEDIKKLVNTIYFKSRDHFTRVDTSDNTIMFTNSILRNIFSKYERFGEISSGIIKIEPKDNFFIVVSTVTFARFILINFVLFVIVLTTVLAIASESLWFAAVVASLFASFILITPQFTAAKFDAMIKSSIKECNLQTN